jgi:hypothetical protein
MHVLAWGVSETKKLSPALIVVFIVVLCIASYGCGEGKNVGGTSPWGDASVKESTVVQGPGPRYNPYPDPEEGEMTPSDYDLGLREGYEDGYWAGFSADPDGYDDEPAGVDAANEYYAEGYVEGYMEGYEDGFYDGLEMRGLEEGVAREDSGGEGEAGEEKSEGRIIDLTRDPPTSNLNVQVAGSYVGSSKAESDEAVFSEALDLNPDGSCFYYYAFHCEGYYWIDPKSMELYFGGEGFLLAGEVWRVERDYGNTEYENAYKLIDENGRIWYRGEPDDPMEVAL